MKSLVCVAVAVAGLAALAVSLAQQTGAPETRTQTHAELPASNRRAIAQAARIRRIRRIFRPPKLA